MGKVSSILYLISVEMLNAFETVARREGVIIMSLSDASTYLLFRENVGEDLANQQLRSTILCALLTGDPTCYYEGRGFEYSDPSSEYKLREATKELLNFSIEEYIVLLEQPHSRNHNTPERWGQIKAFIRDKGDLFHIVFRELHVSAEGGDIKARKMLVDIVRGVFWDQVPGCLCLGMVRAMDKILD
jgi:hypothetical protein